MMNYSEQEVGGFRAFEVQSIDSSSIIVVILYNQ
jgi:hypothetical protein